MNASWVLAVLSELILVFGPMVEVDVFTLTRSKPMIPDLYTMKAGNRSWSREKRAFPLPSMVLMHVAGNRCYPRWLTSIIDARGALTSIAVAEPT